MGTGTEERYWVSRSPGRSWTFITHHGQVLIAVAGDPNLRVAAIAEALEISERYTYRILSDLQKAGYVARVRRGRYNHYRINPDLTGGDPVVEEQSLHELLGLIELSEGPRLLAALAPRRPSS